jgi:hypothetical protein
MTAPADPPQPQTDDTEHTPAAARPDPVDVPSAPRAVTPRALRRSWHERPVRLWLALSILVALATIYFTVRDVSAALRERRLIEHGERVKAKIELIDSSGNPRPVSRDQDRHLKLRYTPKSGRELVTELDLPPAAAPAINVGGTIDLMVDPDHPEVVTAQLQPRTWLASLAVVTMMVPVLLIAVALALWQRRRVLNVWRDGELVEGTVVDWHRSGLAPRSVVVRFTVDEGDDNRVFSTHWPNTAGPIQAGESIELVMPPGRPSRAIAAALYG